MRLVLPAKITEFQYTRLWIEQQVLWLDISMADAKTMYVGEATK